MVPVRDFGLLIEQGGRESGRSGAQAHQAGLDYALDYFSEGMDIWLADQRAGNRSSDGIDPSEFDLRETCIGIMGYAAFSELADYRRPLTESAISAIDSTAFITLYDKVLSTLMAASYENPEFVLSRIIRTIPSNRRSENLGGYTDFKTAGDGSGVAVPEGMPIPYAEFGDKLQETPRTSKYFKNVAVTREAMFFNDGPQIQAKAQTIGDVLGKEKEYRHIDCFIGFVNNFTLNGTTYNTYQSASTWDNDHANEITDVWKAMIAAEGKLVNGKNLTNGEQAVFRGKDLIYPFELKELLAPALNATQFQQLTGANANRYVASNPLVGFRPLQHDMLKERIVTKGLANSTQAAKWWFLGDISKFMGYIENWKFDIIRAPANSHRSFTQHIVFELQAGEMGATAILEPQAMVRNKHAS